MPGSSSKHSKKKELYIAKNMGDLNKMAELPAKLKTNNAKILVKTADKMLKEAEHSDLMEDEERAYVLFMKYFNVVTFLKKTADYRKEKTYYDNLLGAKNLMAAIDKAEELSGSLKERYDLLEAEMVANKLASLENEKPSEPQQPGKQKDNDVSTDTIYNRKEGDQKTNGELVSPLPPKSNPGKLTCAQLYQMLEDRDTQLILMDMRSIEDFQESRLTHKAIINVPASAVKPGTTVSYIEKALPMDSLSLWKQRGNIDHIVLLDWNSRFENVKIGSSLQTLKDALFKYDSTVIIKSEPLILDGGYEQWMLEYPMKCLNPSFDKISRPVVQDTQAGLLDFDYPDYDQEFLQPKPAEVNPGDTAMSSSLLDSISGFQNGGLTTPSGRPTINRSLKPTVDRSTKSNITKISVNTNSDVSESSSSFLYPDVRSAASSKPANQNQGSTNPDFRAGFSNVTYTDSRADNQRTERIENKTELDPPTGLSGISSEISKDLQELERQKKIKEKELEDMRVQSERLIEESQARLEKMREEEKSLSQLEEMKKKEQADVADLMRLKRSLQQKIDEEKQNTRTQELRKEWEEENRQQELAQISRAEEDQRRRQEEVEKLRMERKRKEQQEEIEQKRKQQQEETEQKRKQQQDAEIERKRIEERVLQDAQLRVREEEERRQREITSAEEAARKLRLEQDNKAKEDAHRLEIEERLRRERDLAARAEKERQAALEEQRRKQAEIDRKKEEQREIARQEKEAAERERLERERRAREEEDRRRAEEARKQADEKLRLVNEAKSRTKIVPSPNLPVGWEKKLDPATQRYFYVNHSLGTTQWEPPPDTRSGTYTTKLKDEPETQRRGLSRSNSSPNIAKLLENEDRLVQQQRPLPSVNRGTKPVDREELIPMPAKRRDLNPIYGSVDRALTGLRNLGNSCYMNSTIQCLNNTSPLVTYLITDIYLRDINRDSLGEVVDDFAYVVKALWSGQYRCITPRDLKAVVGRHQPMIAGYMHQDSQEFLTFLMDGLHEGLNKVKVKPRIPEQNNEGLPDVKAAEISWRDHKLHNESIIVELFQGQLKTTIMCLTCRKQSVKFQAFMYLSLPIPKTTRCTLGDCLRQFSAEEKMTGNSKWECPQCRTYRDAIMKLEIWKLPHILLIALNRFVYEGQWRTKINAHVDFPTSGMDMSSFVIGPRPKSYKLYAVSNHFGTLDGGHYTACCKNPCTQTWYKFDDSEVFETSESSVKTSAAYVLYYTSIDLLPPDFKPSFS
ncbi:ubiquitin carboxyl-terminal hydrolase 8-like isoform X2 [Dreissena polymorpha]|uniref:ubiquitin carboxyl-terminal hydrolase 8-like isoform X2 n=1 Tax=Dreissena polymorpha TaxID=45954 RepID=UPI0022653A15|nr:ubiquitin carboxyl-terminal hydrolase 8-like isoform X2 [Dreissena polymorpha]